jgi:hypothetical protein
MDAFISEIISDIDWRVAQMSTLKTIPIMYSFQPGHKLQHIKFSVPAVYALWEGFVKTTLETYIKEIKKLRVKRDDISLNLLTHTIDEICKLNNPRLNFDTKKRIVEELNSIFIDIIDISTSVPTGSNVNYDVISSLLNRFCINEIDKSKYEKKLDKLLLFRNKIAHGDNAILVTESTLTEFVSLVENLMLDIVINIQDSFTAKTYLAMVPI